MDPQKKSNEPGDANDSEFTNDQQSSGDEERGHSAIDSEKGRAQANDWGMGAEQNDRSQFDAAEGERKDDVDSTEDDEIEREQD